MSRADKTVQEASLGEGASFSCTGAPPANLLAQYNAALPETLLMQANATACAAVPEDQSSADMFTQCPQPTWSPLVESCAGNGLSKHVQPELGSCHAAEVQADIVFSSMFNLSLEAVSLPCRVQTLPSAGMLDQSLEDASLLWRTQTLTSAILVTQSLEDIALPSAGVTMPSSMQSYTVALTSACSRRVWLISRCRNACRH